METANNIRSREDANRLYGEIERLPDSKRGSIIEMAISFIREMQAQARLSEQRTGA